MKQSKVLLGASALALFAAVVVSAGGSKEKTPPKAAAPAVKTVAVSILPQAYFVERIAGGRFKTMVLVGPGQSPHSYEPTPRQMSELSGAAAWMSIGVDFEKGLKPKVASLYPKLQIVDTTKGIEYRKLEAHKHEDEKDEHDEHDPSGKDAHVWLGRQAVKAMASNITEALAAIDPEGAPSYKANLGAFVKDIDAAFEELAKDLAPLRGKPVFVYHPAFGYFFDEFGIEQEAVETGGKEPTQKHLAKLIEEARKDEAKVIFVQAQFPAAAAETVAKAIGGIVVKMDPLAPDWLDNVKRIGEALKQAVR